MESQSENYSNIDSRSETESENNDSSSDTDSDEENAWEGWKVLDESYDSIAVQWDPLSHSALTAAQEEVATVLKKLRATLGAPDHEKLQMNHVLQHWVGPHAKHAKKHVSSAQPRHGRGLKDTRSSSRRSFLHASWKRVQHFHTKMTFHAMLMASWRVPNLNTLTH